MKKDKQFYHLLKSTAWVTFGYTILLLLKNYLTFCDTSDYNAIDYWMTANIGLVSLLFIPMITLPYLCHYFFAKDYGFLSAVSIRINRDVYLARLSRQLALLGAFAVLIGQLSSFAFSMYYSKHFSHLIQWYPEAASRYPMYHLYLENSWLFGVIASVYRSALAYTFSRFAFALMRFVKHLLIGLLLPFLLIWTTEHFTMFNALWPLSINHSYTMINHRGDATTLIVAPVACLLLAWGLTYLARRLHYPR